MEVEFDVRKLNSVFFLRGRPSRYFFIFFKHSFISSFLNIYALLKK